MLVYTKGFFKDLEVYQNKFLVNQRFKYKMKTLKGISWKEKQTFFITIDFVDSFLKTETIKYICLEKQHLKRS